MILQALDMQTERDFEIIIADDGSNEETVAKIKEYIDRNPQQNIEHVWQPDFGWRKNQILNKALVASNADYLIMIDGDCVPHPRFVEDHLRLRRRNTAVLGRRADLPQRLSDRMAQEDKLPRNYFSRARRTIFCRAFMSLLFLPLNSKRYKNAWRDARSVVRLPGVGRKRSEGLLGCNFSLWKSDLMAVNGWDERYVDPACGEDTDLELRLANNGLEFDKYRHSALMLHRCHPLLSRNSPNNVRVLGLNKAAGATFTPYGVEM